MLPGTAIMLRCAARGQESRWVCEWPAGPRDVPAATQTAGTAARPQQVEAPPRRLEDIGQDLVLMLMMHDQEPFSVSSVWTFVSRLSCSCDGQVGLQHTHMELMYDIC